MGHPPRQHRSRAGVPNAPRKRGRAVITDLDLVRAVIARTVARWGTESQPTAVADAIISDLARNGFLITRHDQPTDITER
ncbi:MAG: hypothetical protein ACRDQX_10240 [Pseudonocardiaceae bacterium]